MVLLISQKIGIADCVKIVTLLIPNRGSSLSIILLQRNFHSRRYTQHKIEIPGANRAVAAI